MHDIVDIAKNQVNFASKQGRVLVSGSFIKNTAQFHIGEEFVELQEHQMMSAQRADKPNPDCIGRSLCGINNILERLEFT